MNQSTDSKLTAGIIFLVVICAISIGAWWKYPELTNTGISQNDSSQSVSGSSLTKASDSVHGSVNPSPKKTRNGDDNTSSEQNQSEANAKPIDLTETSWLNPFTKSHWLPLKSSGTESFSSWSFGNNSMQCKTGQSVAATFRRPYRKLSIDLQIERPMPTGAFEIRLTASNSNTVLFAEMSETQLEVSISEPKRKRTVLKRYTLKVPVSTEKFTHLRFAATGNRIIIFHNNRKILTCNQPAGLSNRAVHFSLLSRGSSCKVSRLSVDGE